MTAATAALPGVPRSVVVAAGCFAIAAGAAAAVLRLPQSPPSGVLLIGWPAFALAGGILLDQGRWTAIGRLLVAVSLVPLFVLVLAGVRDGGVVRSAQTALDAAAALAPVPAAALLAVPVVARPPRRRVITASALPAAGGVLVAMLAPAGPFRVAGWVLLSLAAAAVWAVAVREARGDARGIRRRLGWAMVVLATAGAVTAGGWWLLRTGPACYLTAIALGLTAAGLAQLGLRQGFRPADEPLFDLALMVAVALGAALVAGLVGLGAELVRVPAPTTSAAFAAVVTAAAGAPAGLWAHRTLLARRYGPGSISPADVAVITADLRAMADPRELLGKAARMVAAASGAPEARLVLGDELPDAGPGWTVHPLDVGGTRAGALAVRSGRSSGPEPRQVEAIERLIPTVALVARAVGLAVEAELARRDVARERKQERDRILSDLHDGLGPVLAGMSMRVRAALRGDPDGRHTALLADLSADLATSRTDLRRIVAGITPTALDDGDLTVALQQLVASFRDQAGGGPALSLEVCLPDALDEPTQVAVYRCVAEGITNALRHAGASAIAVRVACVSRLVTVDIVDDGQGGPVVPGVGLSSLRARANGLGGRLSVGPGRDCGTRLRLELTAEQEV